MIGGRGSRSATAGTARAAGVVAACLVSGACGTPSPAPKGGPPLAAPQTSTSAPSVESTTAAKPYNHPLWVDWTEPDNERPPHAGDGAASFALECDGPIGEAYVLPKGKVTDGGGTVEAALRDYLSEGLLAEHEFRLVRATEDRALFAYDVAGRARSAVIFIKDPWDSERGWWRAESTASCDPAEFPSSDDRLREIEVWTDREGDRVDSRRIVSYRGSELCGWQKIRFLRLNETIRYLRDPSGIFPGGTPGTYRASTKLPNAAVDSGFRRGGAELWLTDDAAYLVTANNVERWPAATYPIGCD